MGVCAHWGAGDGDAGGGGVSVQVVQGGEACGPGGDGDVVPGEQVAGVLDGGAEGGGVDAEQVGQDVQRQAEAGAREGGGDLGGEGELGRAAGAAAGVAAGQVEMVLAGGGGGEFQPGDEAAEVAGGHPGQRGVGQGGRGLVAVRRAGRCWRRRGGPGRGRADGVVPFAVEAVPRQGAGVFHVPELRPGDLDAAGVAAGVQLRGDGQPGRGGGRGDGVDDDLVAGQRAGPPVAGDLGEQPVLYFVPLGGARREVADGDLQPGVPGQVGQGGLPRPGPVPVAPAGAGGDRSRRA